MECFWRLYSHWQQDGDRNQQDQAVFYVHFRPHHGIADHYLHGAGILEKYAEIYLGGETESLVLFVNASGEWLVASRVSVH